MAHRIEISAYEARLLAKQGIAAFEHDAEDSYGTRYFVNETPAVLAVLYGDDDSTNDDRPVFCDPTA